MAAKSKKGKRKKGMKAVQKEIASAVNKIPGLVIEEELNERASKRNNALASMYEPSMKEKKTIHIPERMHKNHVLLWSGVGVLGLFIFGMWFWNIRGVFFDAQNSDVSFIPPLENVQGEFQTLLQAINTKQENIDTEISNLEEEQEVEHTIKTILGTMAATANTNPEDAAPPTNVEAESPTN